MQTRPSVISSEELPERPVFSARGWDTDLELGAVDRVHTEEEMGSLAGEM